MVQDGHEDVLDDVEEDVRREECPDRDVETVSEFKDICATCSTGGPEEALLSSAAREACNART
jgi:hypothetical protein